MKNKIKMAPNVVAMLMLIVCFTVGNSRAQTKTKSTTMKDCCMMKDGKMMYVKNGKSMPMEKDMTLKNGTICMTNGECIMKDGKKMQMKDGECIDMSGNMNKCNMMMNSEKSTTKMKSQTKNMAMTYACPMHPEVTSDKPGKCSKCGMDLVEKK